MAKGRRIRVCPECGKKPNRRYPFRRLSEKPDVFVRLLVCTRHYSRGVAVRAVVV